MITEDHIREILAQYKSFGWKLERILLSSEVKDVVRVSLSDILDKHQTIDSDLNAVWLSRLNENGRVAWELRSLGPTPFALVESTEPNAPEMELIELFERVENQMRKRLIRPREN